MRFCFVMYDGLGYPIIGSVIQSLSCLWRGRLANGVRRIGIGGRKNMVRRAPRLASSRSAMICFMVWLKRALLPVSEGLLIFFKGCSFIDQLNQK